VSTVLKRPILKQIRELVIAADHQSWEQNILPRLSDNTELPIEEFEERNLSRLDLDLLNRFTRSAPEDTYVVYDRIRKSGEIRNLLDHSPADSRQLHIVGEENARLTFRQFRTRDFGAVVEALEPYHADLIHPLFGLFKGHYRGIADSMPLIAFDARLGTRSYDAYGRSSTYTESYYTGLLEALERFHGVAAPNARYVRASEKELEEADREYVPMNRFRRYTESQTQMETFAFDAYSTDKPLKWRHAYDYGNRRNTLVPEQVAYFSGEHLERFDPEPRYLAETSNGTAIGSSWEEAVAASLLEVVERDSFLVHWYTRSQPLRIEGADRFADEDIRLMLAYLEMLDYQTNIFDITLESGIPAYWVLLEYVGEDPDSLAFYTAAGANPNPISAIRSALVEASTSIKVFKSYMYDKYTPFELEELKSDYSKVSRLEDHLYLYSSVSMKPHLEFALQTDRVEPIEKNIARRSMPAEPMAREELLDRLLKPLLQYHPDIYISDLSHSFLTDMGLSCTKIHIPSLQNIGFGMQYQNINRERLEQAIRLNGLDGSSAASQEVPHPFP